MTTIAVVGAATETIGQMQSAKAQQKAIDAQLATTQQEIRVAQTAELNERQRVARKEQARIKVAAGEAGLNIGGSVEALLKDSLMQNQLSAERTNLNAESQQRAAAAEANSMSIPHPVADHSRRGPPHRNARAPKDTTAARASSFSRAAAAKGPN